MSSVTWSCFYSLAIQVRWNSLQSSPINIPQQGQKNGGGGCLWVSTPKPVSASTRPFAFPSRIWRNKLTTDFYTKRGLPNLTWGTGEGKPHSPSLLSTREKVFVHSWKTHVIEGHFHPWLPRNIELTSSKIRLRKSPTWNSCFKRKHNISIQEQFKNICPWHHKDTAWLGNYSEHRLWRPHFPSLQMIE